MTPYRPVDCHFYDELEAASVRGRICHLEIKFPGKDQPVQIQAKIIDLYSRQRVEYARLAGADFSGLPVEFAGPAWKNNELEIRLDDLLRLDDKPNPPVV